MAEKSVEAGGIKEFELKQRQIIKSHVTDQYFKAFIAILARFQEKLLLFDCFAGKGIYESGGETLYGTAVQMLLGAIKHTGISNIKWEGEIHCHLFELKDENFKSLTETVEKAISDVVPSDSSALNGVDIEHGKAYTLRTDKWTLVVNCYHQDMNKLVPTIVQRENAWTPAFVFIDPFGFQAHMETVKLFLKFQKVDMLVNLMTGSVNRFANSPTHSSCLQKLFYCDNCTSCGNITSSEELSQIIGKPSADRLKFIRDMYVRCIGSHVDVPILSTSIEVRGDRNLPKYHLIFITRNEMACDNMIKFVWRNANAFKEEDFTPQYKETEGTRDIRPEAISMCIQRKYGLGTHLVKVESLKEFVQSQGLAWIVRDLKRFMKESGFLIQIVDKSVWRLQF